MAASATRKSTTKRRKRLDTRTVKACKSETKYYDLLDDRIRGFVLRVHPTGSKVFLLRYSFNRVERMLVLGHFGEITPEEARSRAEKARGKIRDGVDPRAEKDTRTGITVAEAWQTYCTQRSTLPYSTGRSTRKPWRPSTLLQNQSAFKAWISKPIGNRPLISITSTDIEAIRDTLGQKGHKFSANRAVAYLSGFFTWAINKKLYPHSNPAKNVAHYEEKPRERVLSDDELPRFMQALNAYEGNIFVPAALKLYLFTGCRRGEILSLQWQDVFLDDGYIRLKEAKGGDRSIALNRDAIAVLISLPRLQNNPYVIPGLKHGSHMTDIRRPFRDIIKLASIDHCTIHDLRRSYGTQALQSGVDLYHLSKLLGHKSVKTTERAYAFLPDVAVQAASDKVADRMRAALNGEHAKVVQIRRPA